MGNPSSKIASSESLGSRGIKQVELAPAERYKIVGEAVVTIEERDEGDGGSRR